jgi:uncharacterized membrane protein
MPIGEVTLLGWFHSAAYTAALIAGAVQLFGAKGTPVHAVRGRIFFWSMVIANGTAMFLFNVDVVVRPGQKPLIGPYFGVFHWLAVFTLLLVLLGRLSANRQKKAFFAYAHPVFMIVSYWIVVGGAINEAFTRVRWLHELALAVSPTAKTLVEYKLVVWCQYVNHAVSLVALVAAISGVRRWRGRKREVVCT